LTQCGLVDSYLPTKLHSSP